MDRSGTPAGRHHGAARSSRRALAIVAGSLLLAVAGCGSSGSAGPTAEPSGSSGPGAELLGAWVTTITRDDLRAGGLTDAGLLNENSGTFTWTFEADGTWTQVQVSLDDAPINAPVFSGTWRVEGGDLVMVTEFPEQYRDEGLHFDYAVDGGSATFDLLDPPDPILPIVVEAHPWTRGEG